MGVYIKPITSYNLGSDRNSSKKDCLLAGSLACLLAGWLAGLLACSLGPFFACLLAGRLACLLAALPPWPPQSARTQPGKKIPGDGEKNPSKHRVPYVRWFCLKCVGIFLEVIPLQQRSQNSSCFLQFPQRLQLQFLCFFPHQPVSKQYSS